MAGETAIAAHVPPIARFDGAEIWSSLPDEAKARIGALALELVVASWIQERAYASDKQVDAIHARAAGAASVLLTLLFDDAVLVALPRDALLSPDGTRPRIPSSLGDVCRGCGCSQNDACADGHGPCAWATKGLCTACARREANRG